MSVSRKIPNFSAVVKVDFDLSDKSSISLNKKREKLKIRYKHFARAMVDHFIDHLQRNGTSGETKKNQVFAFEKFLRFLSIEMCETALKVRALLLNGQFSDINADDAHYIEKLYGKHLHQVYSEKINTVATKVQNANQVFRLMFESGVWPYTLRIPYVHIPEWKPKSRPSLLDSVVQTLNTNVENNTTIHQKNAATSAALNFLGLEYSSDPQKIVSSAIAGEQECLRRIRNELSSKIEASYKAKEFSDSLLANATAEKYQEIKKWLTDSWPLEEKNPISAFKPSITNPFKNAEDVLLNFLIAVKVLYFQSEDSLINQYSPERFKTIVLYLREMKRKFINQEIQAFGLDLDAFNDFFCPSHNLVICTIYLLMAETGLNYSPARDLSVSSIQPDDNKGWLSIATWKDRANGSLIYENIYISKHGEKISSGRAIEKLVQFHKDSNYFQSGESLNDKVFYSLFGILGEGRSVFQFPGEAKSLQVFKSVICNSIGKEAHIFPSQMRVSMLVIQRASDRGLNSATLKAAHKSINTTNNHYAGNTNNIFSISNVAKIREFQNGLEKIAFHNLNLNGSQPDISGLLEKTGLGTLCLTKVDAEESQCVSFEKCPSCPSLRVSTDPNDLAKLIQWVECLLDNKDYILANKGEAWEIRWVFWTQLLEEIMQAGPRTTWAANLAKAKELSKTLPKFHRPALW